MIVTLVNTNIIPVDGSIRVTFPSNLYWERDVAAENHSIPLDSVSSCSALTVIKYIYFRIFTSKSLAQVRQPLKKSLLPMLLILKLQPEPLSVSQSITFSPLPPHNPSIASLSQPTTPQTQLSPLTAVQALSLVLQLKQWIWTLDLRPQQLLTLTLDYHFK